MILLYLWPWKLSLLLFSIWVLLFSASPKENLCSWQDVKIWSLTCSSQQDCTSTPQDSEKNGRHNFVSFVSLLLLLWVASETAPYNRDWWNTACTLKSCLSSTPALSRNAFNTSIAWTWHSKPRLTWDGTGHSTQVTFLMAEYLSSRLVGITTHTSCVCKHTHNTQLKPHFPLLFLYEHFCHTNPQPPSSIFTSVTSHAKQGYFRSYVDGNHTCEHPMSATHNFQALFVGQSFQSMRREWKRNAERWNESELEEDDYPWVDGFAQLLYDCLCFVVWQLNLYWHAHLDAQLWAYARHLLHIVHNIGGVVPCVKNGPVFKVNWCDDLVTHGVSAPISLMASRCVPALAKEDSLHVHFAAIDLNQRKSFLKCSASHSLSNSHIKIKKIRGKKTLSLKKRETETYRDRERIS